ncbi:MAG: 4Fe-4S binding protein [Candidatus Riflebacteria bacterium]|nr:4Fe-4S binding protein [Candidatus Riflebacteria bacterium]
MDRKKFFKSYLLDLLAGVDEAFGEDLDKLADKFPELVRPPGAFPESEFLEKCARCGNCVRACPFFALKPVTMANQFDIGTPSLRCYEGWCRFCDGFPCVEACKTGALSLANHEKLKKIATAQLIAGNCLRSEGQDCQECLVRCRQTKFTGALIITDEQKVPRINPELCSGCGACLNSCPAYPQPAIILKPL